MSYVKIERPVSNDWTCVLGSGKSLVSNRERSYTWLSVLCNHSTQHVIIQQSPYCSRSSVRLLDKLSYSVFWHSLTVSILWYSGDSLIISRRKEKKNLRWTETKSTPYVDKIMNISIIMEGITSSFRYVSSIELIQREKILKSPWLIVFHMSIKVKVIQNINSSCFHI